jgi:hypothetical protein
MSYTCIVWNTELLRTVLVRYRLLMLYRLPVAVLVKSLCACSSLFLVPGLYDQVPGCGLGVQVYVNNNACKLKHPK